jgi:hypothetical protein
MIHEEDRQQREEEEKETAEEAARIERQAKDWAAWEAAMEAERSGDPKWFEKLPDGIASRGLKAT